MNIIGEPLVFNSGSGSGGDDAPAVLYIDFSISSNSYQAEEGMTWEEWVNSNYNTGRFYIAGQSVWSYHDEKIVYNNGQSVFPTEQINNNENYVYMIGGGLIG